MRKRHLPLFFAGLVILICAALVIGLVALPTPASAQQAPPPPSKPPVDPPTEEPTDPPTEEPTDPPTEEPTEEPPTEEPTEEPPTAEPPTEEPPTAEPPTEEPPATEEPAEKPATNQPKSGPSKENPLCKSLLTGTVYGDDGMPTTGAAVIIQGNGDDRSMMTDDKGQFGFGGLCPGSVTVVATLPGGQPSSPATLELDGKNPYYVELGRDTQAAAPDSGEAAVGTALPDTAGADSVPSMPETGSNWLLVASAALLVALLLAVGARLALGSRS